MTDIFEEVEEQLRSERYRQLFFKILPWAAGAAVAALLVALGVWGYQNWRVRQAAEASEATAAAIEVFRQGDAKAADAAFDKIAKDSPKGYRSLALMHQGGIRLEEGKLEEAVKLFDRAAEVAPDPVIADFARLKSAFALMDTAPYASMQERLQPLTDGKRPFNVVAREALAMSKLRAGKLQEARSDFQVLRLTPDAPDAMRQRAELAIAAIDTGAAASIPAAVKAALAAPAPAPTAPSTQPPQIGAGQ